MTRLYQVIVHKTSKIDEDISPTCKKVAVLALLILSIIACNKSGSTGKIDSPALLNK
jgi:hypothetical protein